MIQRLARYLGSGQAREACDAVYGTGFARVRGRARSHSDRAIAQMLNRVSRSGAVALLVLLFATARARVVTANVLQGVAYRLLVAVVAVRAVYMAVVVVVIMVMVAVRAMNVGLLGHCRVTPVCDRRGLSHHCARCAGPDG